MKPEDLLPVTQDLAIDPCSKSF